MGEDWEGGLLRVQRRRGVWMLELTRWSRSEDSLRVRFQDVSLSGCGAWVSALAALFDVSQHWESRGNLGVPAPRCEVLAESGGVGEPLNSAPLKAGIPLSVPASPRSVDIHSTRTIDFNSIEPPCTSHARRCHTHELTIFLYIDSRIQSPRIGEGSAFCVLLTANSASTGLMIVTSHFPSVNSLAAWDAREASPPVVSNAGGIHDGDHHAPVVSINLAPLRRLDNRWALRYQAPLSHFRAPSLFSFLSRLRITSVQSQVRNAATLETPKHPPFLFSPQVAISGQQIV